MATVRLVANTALRKLGVLAAGREARPQDATDALAALQNLYRAWIATGAFGRLRDVVPNGTSYTAIGGERIYRTSEETMSVVLPELISRETYCDYGRERTGYYGTVITVSTGSGGETIVDVQAAQPIGYAVPPRDGSAVVISDQNGGETASWLYDGTIKKWQALDQLTLDDEAPRSSADAQGLAACLAMEIADEYAREVPGMTQQQAARFRSAMTARFGFEREAVAGVYC